jgi:hypothetical protein
MKLLPGVGVGAAKPTLAQMLSRGADVSLTPESVQEQEDAQEFFQFIVDQGHEELMKLCKECGMEEEAGAGGRGRFLFWVAESAPQ